MKRAQTKIGRTSPVPKRKTPAPKGDAALEAATDSSAKLLGLKIKANWRPQVLANLAVTLQHAVRVAEFELPEDIEPAPVFKA